MIPTAEEFFIKFWKEPYNPEIHEIKESDILKVMVEFAKIHVQAALEAAIENAKVKEEWNCTDHTPFRGECLSCGSYHNFKINTDEVDEESILNAYSLANIK